MDASDTVWSLAVQECRDDPEGYGEGELPGIFHQISEDWTHELSLRYATVMILALLPAFLGLLQGMHELRLSGPGDYLAGFNEVFFPLEVASVESLLCGLWIWTARQRWAGTIAEWKSLASQAVWEEVELELQRRKVPDVRITEADESMLPIDLVAADPNQDVVEVVMVPEDPPQQRPKPPKPPVHSDPPAQTVHTDPPMPPGPNNPPRDEDTFWDSISTGTIRTVHPDELED